MHAEATRSHLSSELCDRLLCDLERVLSERESPVGCKREDVTAARPVMPRPTAAQTRAFPAPAGRHTL